VDSVPAILGITLDPFIVFTSNIFAILGLRALYFVLAGAIERFRHLHYGLSAVLIFIGVKMSGEFIATQWAGYEEPHLFPSWVSLVVIAILLGVSIAASLIATRRERAKQSP
jgi:tellurite resistance protein TerC